MRGSGYEHKYLTCMLGPKCECVLTGSCCPLVRDGQNLISALKSGPYRETKQLLRNDVSAGRLLRGRKEHWK
jgi:hypothetical protein